MSDEQTDQDDNKTLTKTGEAHTSDTNKHGTDKREKSRAKKASSKKTKRGGAVPIVLLVIVLGLLGVAGHYAYRFYLQITETLNTMQRSQSAYSEHNQEFEDAVLKRVEAMQASQQEVTDYIEVLREKNQHLRKDWLLMESEYLIQLANYRLLFERDINTAIVALESADQRLRNTGDPGIIGVRKVIAEAVQELKQIPQADLAGLSLQLSAINKEIDKLPLQTPDPKSRVIQEQPIEQVGSQVESWSQLPAAIWRDLKSLVQIRDHEAPLQPMLAPKERFFLIENVRLQLEQARLAMLSGQSAVYKERINTAAEWIDEYFDTEASITKTTLDSLNKLVNESIAPELPDIAYTYRALQKYRLGHEVPVKRTLQNEKTAVEKQVN